MTELIDAKSMREKAEKAYKSLVDAKLEHLNHQMSLAAMNGEFDIKWFESNSMIRGDVEETLIEKGYLPEPIFNKKKEETGVHIFWTHE